MLGFDRKVPTVATLFATMERLIAVSALRFGFASIVPVPPSVSTLDVIVCVVARSN